MHFCIVEFLLEIEQYISGNLSFAEGVKIFNKVSTNYALKQVFALGDDEYSREKLRSEFQKMLSAYKLANTVIEAAVEVATSFEASPSIFLSHTVSKKKGSINVSKLPVHLQVEYYKLSPIIREMASLHAKLPLYQKDEERFVAAKRIIELSKARRKIFNRLDYFEENGTDHPFYIKPKAAVKEIAQVKTSYAEAQYQLNLLRAQRSKLKKKPDRYLDLQEVIKKIEYYTTIKPDAV